MQAVFSSFAALALALAIKTSEDVVAAGGKSIPEILVELRTCLFMLLLLALQSAYQVTIWHVVISNNNLK